MILPYQRVRLEDEKKKIYIAMGKCLTNYIQFSRSAMSDSCLSVAFLTSMI